MVSLADVKANNTSLPSTKPGLTAVVVGGTNGIGLGTLKALTKHADSPTLFIVGRDEARLRTLIDSTLEPLNASATFHPIVAKDLTLIADAQKAADAIVSSGVSKIDLLLMSPGYISFTREMSPEGVDRLTSIRYYARLRFLVTLLPLLRAASSPRVVSVLGGGQEGPLWSDDWTMERHWGLINAAGASASLMTLMFEELAKKAENKSIAFVHLFPGLVGDTGLAINGLGPVASFFLTWFVQPVIRLVGYSGEQVGERVLFAATSAGFQRGEGAQKGSNGIVGSGVYLVQGNSSVMEGNETVKKMREDGMGGKVYEHTMEVFDRVEKM